MKPILFAFVFLLSLSAFAAKPAPLRQLRPEPNSIYFAGLSTKLDSNAIRKLTTLSQELSHRKWSEIQLIGHAYRCKNPKVCLEIQNQRNLTVKSFLVKKGIKPYKINTITFGDSIHPGAGDTPAAQALEQKVEILVK